MNIQKILNDWVLAVFSLVEDSSRDLIFHSSFYLFFLTDLSLNLALGLALSPANSSFFLVNFALLPFFFDRHKFGAMILVQLSQASLDQQMRIVGDVVVLVYEHVDFAVEPGQDTLLKLSFKFGLQQFHVSDLPQSVFSQPSKVAF